MKYWRLKIRWEVWSYLADFYLHVNANTFSKSISFSLEIPLWALDSFVPSDEELQYLDSIDFPGC